MVTDTNHIEVLREIRRVYIDPETIAALDAAITALSARASAGEGGEWVMVPRGLPLDMWEAAVKARNLGGDMKEVYEAMLTAAPQPAQAGASGGSEVDREFIPRFSSHGHGRKTHIQIGVEGKTLCGVEARNPHLLMDSGESHPLSGLAEYLDADACGYACKTCEKLARVVLTTPASPATGDAATWEEEIRRHDATPPARGDGEGDAFEAWASSQKYDMTTHPLHWLFLNERTYAARQGWKAGMEYALTTRPTPEAQEARDAVRSKGVPGYGGVPIDFDDPELQQW